VSTPARLRPEAVRARPLEAAAELLQADVVGSALHGAAVTGVTHDSRAVVPGDVYAALPGSRGHGANFAAQAVAAGARAVLTDPAGRAAAAAAGVPVLVIPDVRARLGQLAGWVYGEPARDLLVIGVTGTNGKTTTAYLLEGGLRGAGHRTGLLGTIETRIGEETAPSVRTTPEATDLHALLAVMRERGVTAVAMEVSSHALALGRVGGLVFDVALFTNLSADHLDFHADLEDYFAAKAALFTAQRCRQAVVDVDDAYGRRLAAAVDVPVTTVSVGGGVTGGATGSAAGSAADWRASDVAADPTGASRFRARGPAGQDLEVVVGLAGDFNVANALLAVAGLRAAGVAGADVVRGLRGVSVPGRMERVDDGQPFSVVVDYAHSPDALARAVAALRPATRGRLLLVVGCGGDRDPHKRPLMGEIAARAADVVVVTDDNPRAEDPAAIRAAVLAGTARVPAPQRAEVVELGDRRAAIREAVRRARAGDTLLVAGKGHETGQEVDGAVLPFDDRRVVRAALHEIPA
jgi:UDP-N-acetylmuramoyl-L-alanyl-D-glutamate--2,6-diaminopimelate ligase